MLISACVLTGRVPKHLLQILPQFQPEFQICAFTTWETFSLLPWVLFQPLLCPPEVLYKKGNIKMKCAMLSKSLWPLRLTMSVINVSRESTSFSSSFLNWQHPGATGNSSDSCVDLTTSPASLRKQSPHILLNKIVSPIACLIDFGYFNHWTARCANKGVRKSK